MNSVLYVGMDVDTEKITIAVLRGTDPDVTEELVKKGLDREEVIAGVRERMFGFFEVQPEMVEGAKMLFDGGTSRLYDEVLSRI